MSRGCRSRRGCLRGRALLSAPLTVLFAGVPTHIETPSGGTRRGRATSLVPTEHPPLPRATALDLDAECAPSLFLPWGGLQWSRRRAQWVPMPNCGLRFLPFLPWCLVFCHAQPRCAGSRGRRTMLRSHPSDPCPVPCQHSWMQGLDPPYTMMRFMLFGCVMLFEPLPCGAGFLMF